MQPLVRLDNVSVAFNGNAVLRGVSWELLPGQHWAIVGQNGSGKSTLLKLIRGELWPAAGKRTYFLNGQEQALSAVGVKESFGAVSPELQERYLQQEWRLTGRDVVFSGFANTDYVYIRPTAQQRAYAEGIIQMLGIQKLLRRDVQQLSTGELRKVLIARALAGRPAVLILDEVCDSLDVHSRGTLLEAVERIARSGTQVLYASHRQDELIAPIGNMLELQDGRVVRHAARRAQPVVLTRPTAAVQTRSALPGRVLIHMKNASVYLGGKLVLQRLNWELRENEHWAILGPNGAGKSTFLKLVAGDVHPAADGVVRRWDFTPKNTLWDIRQRVGFMSPELQARYRDAISAMEVIASGLFSSFGLREPPTSAQWRKVRQLMKRFGVDHLAARRVGEMSYGEFRKLLLLRALIHEPQLLLCDEPFDGLDAAARRAFRETLECVAKRGTQLVIVTHHVDELPGCVTNVLTLHQRTPST